MKSIVGGSSRWRLVRWALPLLLVIALASCSPGPTDPDREIVIGAPGSLLASLVWLADEEGFFDKRGVRVRLREFPSGKRALAALLDGRLDLAVTAETPFVLASFDHEDLRLFATVGTSDNEVRVVARADRAIAHPEDLAGHRIATQRGSAVHFFLSTFLLYHFLRPDDVDLVFLEPEDLPAALARGDIDAFSMREPFLQEARERLAERLIEFAAPGIYTKSYNLVGSRSFAREHRLALEATLRGLRQALDFARQRPVDAIEVIARLRQLPPDRVADVWPDLHFDCALNQFLLNSLDEEARWAVAVGLVDAAAPPNLLHYLDWAPLTQVAPRAVTLFAAGRTPADENP